MNPIIRTLTVGTMNIDDHNKSLGVQVDSRRKFVYTNEVVLKRLLAISEFLFWIMFFLWKVELFMKAKAKRQIADRCLRAESLRVGNFNIPFLRFSTISLPTSFLTRNTNTKFSGFFSRRNAIGTSFDATPPKPREQRDRQKKVFLTLKRSKETKSKNVSELWRMRTREIMRLFMCADDGATCGFASNDGISRWKACEICWAVKKYSKSASWRLFWHLATCFLTPHWAILISWRFYLW